MSKPNIADAGWAEHTIDYLRQALKSAEAMASDLVNLRLCDAARCGKMFDVTDPRCATVPSNGVEYNFCPACNMESIAEADARRTHGQEQKTD